MQMLHSARFVSAALAALMLSGAPALARTTGIRSIDVTARLDAFRAAPEQSTVLPGLLKQAIAARLADRLDVEGRAIRVRIASEVLPKPADGPNGRAVLTGVVFVLQPAKGGNSSTPFAPAVKRVYWLTITSAAPPSPPAGTDAIVMPPDGGNYQQALVNSFADYVVRHL